MLFTRVSVQSSSTVVVQPGQNMVMMNPVYGPNPVQMTCPHCRAQILTATNSEAGTLTWLLCVGLCIVG